jgi:hypothetical protein
MQGETRPSPLEPLSKNYCARPWGGEEGEKRWGGSVRNFICQYLATPPSPCNLKSGVWEHFIRDSVRQIARYKLCKASLKTGGGSTRSLHTHLQTKHSINVLKSTHTADFGSDDEDKLGNFLH